MREGVRGEEGSRDRDLPVRGALVAGEGLSVAGRQIGRGEGGRGKMAAEAGTYQ